MKIKKDFLSLVFNILIIVFVLIANGLLSFIGFDFSIEALKQTAYWVKYISNGLSAVLVYISVKNMSNQRFLRDHNIVKEIEEISYNRKMVEDNQKTKEARAWVNLYFNPKQRLVAYQRKINNKLNKLKLKKPTLNGDRWYNKKVYEIRNKKYNREIEHQDYYYKQLDYCNSYDELLEIIVSNDKNKERYNELSQIIKEKDFHINNNKLKYEEIEWSTLITSNYEEEYVGTPKLNFNAKKENAKDIPKLLFTMLLFNMILTSLQPFINGEKLTLAIVLQSVLFSIWLLSFAIRAVGRSSKLIKGKYYKALKERNRVFAELVKDINVFEIEFIEEEGDN